jgi:hypothetical protein
MDDTSRRTDLVIRTEFGAQLVGTIVDSRGRPVAAASVSIQQNLTTHWTITTDEHGRFACYGIPSGTYAIAAWHGNEGSLHYRAELQANRRVDVEIQTMPSRVAGYVVDPIGQPVADARVGVGTWGPEFFSARTDQDGHFDFGGVPAGEHDVSLVSDEGQRVWNARAHSTADAPVTLVFPRRTTVIGRVLLDGVPVTSFRIRVIVDETIEGPLLNAPDGRFTVHGIHAGKRWLDIDGDDFYKGMRIDIPLDIPEGGTFDVGDIAVTRHRSQRDSD